MEIHVVVATTAISPPLNPARFLRMVESLSLLSLSLLICLYIKGRLGKRTLVADYVQPREQQTQFLTHHTHTPASFIVI